MNQPIQILYAGHDLTEGLCAEVLRCEGFPWFEERPAEAFEDALPGAQLFVVAGAGLSVRAVERIAKAVAGGVSLIAVSPDPGLASAFGVTAGEAVRDAHLLVRDLAGWEHGDIPLLCPDAGPLSGGRRVADLRDAEGRACGAGVVATALGRGRAWVYGYDLPRTVATLRHGTGRLDERPGRDMGPLAGPRHLYGFFELSDRLPRDAPVCDLHQDVLRTLVKEALSEVPLPRLWHFPDGAPALWFIKGDGCGEEGADVEVGVAERHGAYLTFYRPPESRYSGDLMRDWHARGHGISIEANINGITQVVKEVAGQPVRQGRTVRELNARWLPTIRAQLEGHRDAFARETGLEMDTVCIHSCQWSGLPMARMILDLGWHTPTHFISHDPRMRRDVRYGPYMISSALPMRYFERETGVLDLWHMPAQWDESQTIGRYEALVKGPPPDWAGFGEFPGSREFFGGLAPDRAAGMVGLTAEEYGTVLARFAEEAAGRWHGVQICNFHPVYVAIPQDHPRASRRALEMGAEGARTAGCRFENLERWSRFFRARAGVRLADWRREGEADFLTLQSAEGIEGLTLLLPDGAVEVREAEKGEALAAREWALEGRRQRGVVVNLGPGTPVTLRVLRR